MRVTDLDEARATIRRLNRRVQAAESAANETIAQMRRAGGSFGRSLANYAAARFERERYLEIEIGCAQARRAQAVAVELARRCA